jgi:hypothetical protein
MTKNPVQTLVKHVGRGKTLAKDLSIEQAREALERLLGGEFTQSQTGAFLQALRIKETSADELVGAALGVASYQVPSTLPVESMPLVVNIAFDTPRKGGVLSILAAAYLRRTGLAQPVVVWEPPSLFREVGAVDATHSEGVRWWPCAKWFRPGPAFPRSARSSDSAPSSTLWRK